MTSKLIRILLLASAVFVVAFLLSERITQQDTQREQEASSTRLAVCEPTIKDSEGPFYIEGSPYTSKIAPIDAIGEKLIIKGKITGTDCVTPLENIVLDIWHADERGEYSDTSYRGKVTTSENGNYQFETILPASYLSGVVQRPPHIHFKILQNSRELLTSQMYFEKSMESDDTQVVILKKENQTWIGNYGIVLKP